MNTLVKSLFLVALLVAAVGVSDAILGGDGGGGLNGLPGGNIVQDAADRVESTASNAVEDVAGQSHRHRH